MDNFESRHPAGEQMSLPAVDERGRANLAAVLDTDGMGRTIYRTVRYEGKVITWNAEPLLQQLSEEERQTLLPELLPFLGREVHQFWTVYVNDSPRGPIDDTQTQALVFLKKRVVDEDAREGYRIETKTLGHVFEKLIQMARNLQEAIADPSKKKQYRKAELALRHALANGDRLPHPEIQRAITRRLSEKEYEKLPREQIFQSLPATILDKWDLLSLGDYNPQSTFNSPLTVQSYETRKYLANEGSQPVAKLNCYREVPSALATEDAMIANVQAIDEEAKRTGIRPDRVSISGTYMKREEIELKVLDLQELDLPGLTDQALELRSACFNPDHYFFTVKRVLKEMIREKEATLKERQGEQSPFSEFNYETEELARNVRRLEFILENLEHITPGLGDTLAGKATGKTQPNLHQLEDLLGTVKQPLERA